MTTARCAKAMELRQAIDDCAMRRRVIRSDAADPAKARERAARLRQDGERLLRQADEIEANLRDWRKRDDVEERRVNELRVELMALRKEEEVEKAQQALSALQGMAPDALLALRAERPDLAPLLDALMKSEELYAVAAGEAVLA